MRNVKGRRAMIVSQLTIPGKDIFARRDFLRHFSGTTFTPK